MSRAHQNSLVDTGRPDLDAQIHFARAAEEQGIDSLLIDFGWSKPDPILLAAAVGMATSKVGFIIAHRSGLTSPTAFVQQINTLSTLINGRLSLNIVAGHSPAEQRGYGDMLPHDERYERTEEFLAVCHAFWRSDGDVNFAGRYYSIEHGRLNTPFQSAQRMFPELLIAGGSAAAQRLSVSQGTCWMRLADTPARLAAELGPVLHSGTEVGLRCAIVARPSHDEAVDAAHAVAAAAGTVFDDRGKEREFVAHTDSVSFRTAHELADNEWLPPCMWTGAVRSHGAAAIALVGSVSEISSTLLAFGRLGVSQFILSGWPNLDEMQFFGRHVLPMIREQEHAALVPVSG
jgi:alkanesulfonate monooxygenase